MCGICGMVSRSPLGVEEIAAVRGMNSLLVHRGPDGSGEFQDQHVAMAMRRLSVIDPSGGWQPLYNEDESLVLVANGEIYNFVELRSQMQARGHVFKTGSDCEVVLHLYEDLELGFVHPLRGMFAFALWDKRKERLVLARDRMGEKPLYLFRRGDLLVFASELKALLRSGMVPFALDPVSTDLFFHYQYVPEPATPVTGVSKLPAAHILVVDVNGWRISERCYWKMEDAPPLNTDPVEAIREELETVSSLTIRSDVPVGVALSGGLDSSAIAALAVQKYPGTIQAFSVGYPGRPANDERAEAKSFAEFLGLPFREIELNTGEMKSFFPELVYWRDDPIADISGYGYYAVAKIAREEGVPVLLQGQGGDELFWGYPWVRMGVEQSTRKRNLQERGWAAIGSYLNPARTGPNARSGRRPWVSWLKGVRDGWTQFRRDWRNPRERLVFYDVVPDFAAAVEGAKDLYATEWIGRLADTQSHSLFQIERPWPNLEVALTRLVCETYLLGNGITQGDRLSMASSVEMRLPLVDHRLVEIVVGLRKRHGDCHLPSKTWFRNAVDGVLPRWVLDRPKQGFAPPVRAWHDAVFQKHGTKLEEGYLVQARVLRPKAARRMATGPFPPGVICPLSFKALVFEIWCRRMSSLAVNGKDEGRFH
jgi:asparagine synthase (glutamine-hydrolysing)